MKPLFNSFIYLISDALSKGLAFFLIPLLTSLLTIEDFGLYVNAISIIQILSLVLGLSSYSIFASTFFKTNKNQFSKYLYSSLYIGILSCIFFLIFFSFFLNIFVDYSFLGLYTLVLIIICLIAFLNYIITIGLKVFILLESPKSVALVTISKVILDFTITYFTMTFISQDWEMRLYGMMIGGFISAFLTIYFIYGYGYRPTKIKLDLAFFPFNSIVKVTG